MLGVICVWLAILAKSPHAVCEITTALPNIIQYVNKYYLEYCLGRAMPSIPANELKTRGVTAIEQALAENTEAIVSVRGCPSSDNLGRMSAFRTGGSGSPLIEVMRFQFRGASAGRIGALK